MLMLVSSSVSSKLSLVLHAKLGYCSTSPDTGEQQCTFPNALKPKTAQRMEDDAGIIIRILMNE
jgi:hypothetical protein